MILVEWTHNLVVAMDRSPIDHSVQRIQPEVYHAREGQILGLILHSCKGSGEYSASNRRNADSATTSKETRLNEDSAEDRAENSNSRGHGPVTVGLINASGA
jgi:hypothetical protein